MEKKEGKEKEERERAGGIFESIGTEQNRTEQNRTEQNRTEQTRRRRIWERVLLIHFCHCDVAIFSQQFKANYIEKSLQC